MKKLVFLGIISIVGLAFGSAFAADNMPSAKAAAAINALTSLRSDSSADAWDNDQNSDSTAWTPILTTQIKTPNKKELAFDVALQCGLITDTTVRSKGGAKDGAAAEGAIKVRVKITDADGNVSYAEPAKEYADPFNPDGTSDGITYCDRFQKLEANFAGLNCWAAAYTVEGYCDGYIPATCIGELCADGVTACTEDTDCSETLGSCTAGLVGESCSTDDACDDLGGDTVTGECRGDDICIAGKVGEPCDYDLGPADQCDLVLGEGDVYCEDPEELRLVLKTLSAHAFNFLAVDVPPGVQTIDVEAMADTAAELSGTKFGEAASTALVGVGSMFVESVRMVKGAETEDDIITLE